ncbi:MAG: V-type ATP synthase subunit E [Methanomicrobiales archaeon]|nr:V-type ATP synthase subunit E [Methanomicrobiales archaeon]
MKYDHLIQAIEDGAEEKLRDIRDSRDREIRDIREREERESGQLRKDLLAETKRLIDLENNKRMYSAREQIKEKLARARQEACLSVFQEAAERLSSIRASPSYEAFFEAVLSEITESLNSEKIRLHIDKKDEALCRQLVKNTGKEVEVVIDLSTVGGLSGSTPDGKVVVRNTIEDRLVRARERMNVVVFSGLYGDRDVR